MTSDSYLLFLVYTILALVLVGCGSSALQINAEVASAMLEIQSASGPAIREARAADMRRAAREVHDSGGTQAEAEAAASEVSRRWRCAVDAHRLFQTAVGTYIDSIALWQAGREFTLMDGIPFVRRGLDTYRVLVSCLNELGTHVLPDVPDFANNLPPAWELSY